MTTMTIRISQGDKDILTEMGKELDLSLSYIVRQALKEYIANHSK